MGNPGYFKGNRADDQRVSGWTVGSGRVLGHSPGFHFFVCLISFRQVSSRAWRSPQQETLMSLLLSAGQAPPDYQRRLKASKKILMMLKRGLNKGQMESNEHCLGRYPSLHGHRSGLTTLDGHMSG